MTTDTEVIEKIEILFAVEGHKRHFQADAHPKLTVAEFAVIAAKKGEIGELVEIFVEDADDPLGPELILVEHLSAHFAPLHVARPGLIRTTVGYQTRHVEKLFRPSATIGRIIEWAIGPDGFKLEGTPADYQLKHDGVVLSADEHLGQVAGKHKAVELDLVFKVKPQG